MKLKLVMIFIGVVLILLMFGLEIVQGDDTGYPPPENAGYPIDLGYPIENEILGYPVDDSVPNGFIIASSPEIELSSITYQLEPIAPQYVNGRNLWQEIVFQFAKLLELMK